MSDELTVKTAKVFRQQHANDFKLPCDLKLGGDTFKKGLSFITFKKSLDRFNKEYRRLASEQINRKHPNLKQELDNL